jgi:succinate dehydrogenase / fumarate reductase membrane anchor subunit
VVKRIAVGAHYGLKDWLAQRVTAVLMALYTVLWVGIAVYYGGIDEALWRALFASWPCCGMPGSGCATSGWTT